MHFGAVWCSLLQFGVVWRTFAVFLCSLVLTAAQLAQLDKRRSTEWEVVGIPRPDRHSANLYKWLDNLAFSDKDKKT